MADKMNICLINDSFPPIIDGVANAVLNYASIIEKEYGTATVATPYYPNADDSVYPYKVVRFPSIDTTKLVGYRAGFPFSAEVLEEIRSQNIDLIHTHCPITSTFLARTLRDTLDAPVVLTYHTKFDIDIANAIRGKLLQKGAIKALVENISACDEVWAVSRGAEENLRSIGYTGEYTVMENGVDIPKGRVPDEAIAKATAGFDLPQGVPVFLFVGRMVWYKGLRCILEAMAELSAKGRDFRMVFIGGGTDKDGAEELAKQLGIENKCFFTGPIYDRDTIRAWYCRGDLFLFPSEFDTNGLVVREAAACGLGSMLIEGSCAAEGINDGETGFLIKNTSANMSEYLQYKIGYHDDASGKNYGMCMSVLNKCQDSTYTGSGQNIKYNPANNVIKEYLSRTLTQLKAQQDTILANYAESCVSDVTSCLNSNNYDASATDSTKNALAIKACNAVISTCMSVNGITPDASGVVTMSQTEWIKYITAK